MSIAEQSQEQCSYLHYLASTLKEILHGEVDPDALDVETIELLYLRMPAHSLHDRKHITEMFHARLLFKQVLDPEIRGRLQSRVLLCRRFITMRSFGLDMNMLERCERLMREPFVPGNDTIHNRCKTLHTRDSAEFRASYIRTWLESVQIAFSLPGPPFASTKRDLKSDEPLSSPPFATNSDRLAAFAAAQGFDVACSCPGLSFPQSERNSPPKLSSAKRQLSIANRCSRPRRRHFEEQWTELQFEFAFVDADETTVKQYPTSLAVYTDMIRAFWGSVHVPGAGWPEPLQRAQPPATSEVRDFGEARSHEPCTGDTEMPGFHDAGDESLSPAMPISRDATGTQAAILQCRDMLRSSSVYPSDLSSTSSLLSTNFHLAQGPYLKAQQHLSMSSGMLNHHPLMVTDGPSVFSQRAEVSNGNQPEQRRIEYDTAMELCESGDESPEYIPSQSQEVRSKSPSSGRGEAVRRLSPCEPYEHSDPKVVRYNGTQEQIQETVRNRHSVFSQTAEILSGSQSDQDTDEYHNGLELCGADNVEQAAHISLEEKSVSPGYREASGSIRPNIGRYNGTQEHNYNKQQLQETLEVTRKAGEIARTKRVRAEEAGGAARPTRIQKSDTPPPFRVPSCEPWHRREAQAQAAITLDGCLLKATSDQEHIYILFEDGESNTRDVPKVYVQVYSKNEDGTRDLKNKFAQKKWILRWFDSQGLSKPTWLDSLLARLTSRTQECGIGVAQATPAVAGQKRKAPDRYSGTVLRCVRQRRESGVDVQAETIEL